MKKIIINPITRISGFLELQVYIEKNKIMDVKSSGMLFRGFEEMLKNRSPLDAIYFTERICGICSTAHSMSSALALENMLGIMPSYNDKIIRDFIHACEFLQNHLRHFYQYSLPDFIITPHIPPLQQAPSFNSSLPDKINRKLGEHYLNSFQYSRKAHEMLAELGGKAPHNHGIFVGGVTVNFDSSKLIRVKSLLAEIKSFVENIMLEDADILTRYYPEYFNNGRGYGNLLSYGVFDFPAKVLLNGKYIDFDVKNITENIRYAWYQEDEIISKPSMGDAKPDRLKENAYSWVKAPRYQGYPMEVGPLARLYLNGIYNRGISTMDRIISRVLEVRVIIKIMEKILEKIELIPSQQKIYTIPDNAEGIGLIDTTRGSLGHWHCVKNKKINHYSIITPTAWNLSPRDSKGYLGVIEKALIGTEIENINNPVEIGRIVRSFDPCVSCATHVVGPNNFSLRIV